MFHEAKNVKAALMKQPFCQTTGADGAGDYLPGSPQNYKKTMKLITDIFGSVLFNILFQGFARLIFICAKYGLMNLE